MNNPDSMKIPPNIGYDLHYLPRKIILVIDYQL